MLSAIFSSLGGAIIDKFFGNALKAFEMYNNKQISMEELKVRLLTSLVDAVKEVEVAHAQALANTFTAFMGAVKESKILQWTLATVTLSQLLVLLWHQVGIPWFVLLMQRTEPTFKYPSSGTTVDWAYLLLAACIGAGPILLRAGPGAGNLTDRFKALVNK
jgi:hypothetical protein